MIRVNETYAARVIDRLTNKIGSHDLTAADFLTLTDERGIAKVLEVLGHIVEHPEPPKSLIELLSACLGSSKPSNPAKMDDSATFTPDSDLTSELEWKSLQDENKAELIKTIYKESNKINFLPKTTVKLGLEGLLVGNPCRQSWLLLRMWKNHGAASGF